MLEATTEMAGGTTSSKPSSPETVRGQFLANTEASSFRVFIDVIIEFGHNDGGGNPAASSTAEVVGESLTDSTTVTLSNGSTEVVYTYTQ